MNASQTIVQTHADFNSAAQQLDVERQGTVNPERLDEVLRWARRRRLIDVDAGRRLAP